MKQIRFRGLGLVALAAIAIGMPARAEGPTGLDVPIGDPSRSDQEYVWISNASNLPLFVERVYPGLEAARKALNVNVRIAGPTAVDLGAFITTVDAECTKVDGRRISFRVKAHDGIDTIGEGTHERMIVRWTRFVARVNEKAKAARGEIGAVIWRRRAMP